VETAQRIAAWRMAAPRMAAPRFYQQPVDVKNDIHPTPHLNN
jgi:hypothetical protein